MNHTSDQHAWFQESRSSRIIPSGIGTSERPAQQLAGQLRRECLGIRCRHASITCTCSQRTAGCQLAQSGRPPGPLGAFRFWMERGVDGFRLDVFNAYFKHPDFPDNPPQFGLRGFDRQRHIYDMDQPEMLPLLNELRRLLDSYPERYSVGETDLATPQKTVSYCGLDKLHAAFSFDFTSHELSFP